MQTSSNRTTLKIVVLGDAGVGKTSILNRYHSEKFTGQYKATIGADFVTKQTMITDSYGIQHLVILQIWDTAGQERFQSLGYSFYRGADGVILVYDITDVESLDHLSHWKSEFLNKNQQTTLGGPGFPFIVLGNKADKEASRRVPRSAALQWCHPSIPHLDTSAKTNLNIDDAFVQIARQGLQYQDYKRRSEPPQLFVPPPSVDLYKKEENEKCC